MASKSSPDAFRPLVPASVPPPIDLKHMTSNSALVSPTRDPRRTSQHLRTTDPRLGSRSPSSIPSSPTSIHSSSSAIFERDIEPIVPPSPPHSHHHGHGHPPNPHRIPRAKGTEALEHSVPSVLDSAAAVLGSLDAEDVSEQVSVVAPAAAPADFGRSSGFASPIGSFRSRSPSPLGSRASGQARADLLLSIPTGSPPLPLSSAMSSPPISVLGLTSSSPPAVVSPAPSLTSSPRPQFQATDTSATITQVSSGNNSYISNGSTAATGDAFTSRTMPPIVTEASVTSPGDVDAISEEEPATTTQEHPPFIPSPTLSPLPLHSAFAASPHSQSLLSSPASAHMNLSPNANPNSYSNASHPPSPVHLPKKRLSFMSYSDLLSSTPAATQTLSSLTTSASSEPPPHIPSVSGLNIVNAIQAQQSLQSSPHSPQLPLQLPGSATPSLRGFSLVPTGGLTHVGKRDSIALLDNVGGEWERQGLGRGLEERLEALVIPAAGSAVPMQPVVPVGGKV